MKLYEGSRGHGRSYDKFDNLSCHLARVRPAIAYRTTAVT